MLCEIEIYMRTQVFWDHGDKFIERIEKILIRECMFNLNYCVSYRGFASMTYNNMYSWLLPPETDT